MFVSRRFVNVPTKSSRARLDLCASNSQVVRAGESDRGAVVAIQSALSDLNRGYLELRSVNGFFGPETTRAVEGFQRDFGLVPDGMVGKQTLSQLDQLFAPGVARDPIGVSLHIGVNRLDANHYGGGNNLTGCERDAEEMERIASSLGYETSVLLSEEATSLNVIECFRGLSGRLSAGDALLFTFSGHGSQVPSVSLGEEDDGLDETLCLFDRMLLDDELHRLICEVPEGVSVTLVFDSCHSGTAFKDISFGLFSLVGGFNQAFFGLNRFKDLQSRDMMGILFDCYGTVLGSEERYFGREVDENDVKPISSASLDRALKGDSPTLVEFPARSGYKEAASVFANQDATRIGSAAKSISFFKPIYEQNKAMYDAIGLSSGSFADQVPVCSVVALSACADNQLALSGELMSAFTYSLVSAYDSGYDLQSLSALHKRLKALSGPASVPQITYYGAGNASSRQFARPFAF
jgi:hypothetical protein